jgi:SHAQKYF class myb-like DNA-binding protein
MEEPPEDAPQQASSSGEKTGRWTDEEHTRFLHGLELFGKKWTKVADVVGSRTTVQVRSHAQKYFQKLEKDRAAPSGGGGSAAGRSARPGGFGAAGRSGFDFDDDGDRGGQAIAVPPALRRFLPPAVAANGRAGAADVAQGLFKFLSPLSLPGGAGHSGSSTKVNEMARRIFDDDPSRPPPEGARSRPAPPPAVPEWYRRGGKIDELLGDAAQIRWEDDDGGAPLRDEPRGGDAPPGDARRKPNPGPKGGASKPLAFGGDGARGGGDRGSWTGGGAIAGPSAEALRMARSTSAQWGHLPLSTTKRRREGEDGEGPPHEALGADRGDGALPRFSSFDALYSASLLVDKIEPKRPRTASQGSEKDGTFEAGVFYDDPGLSFDDAPAF